MPQTPPEIRLPRVRTAEKPDLAAVRKAFAAAPLLPFAQAWAARPEAGFQEGTAQIGWCPDYLHVFAAFADTDIVVLERAATQSRIVVGDVFQVFVEKSSGEGYLEIHVTPDNQTRVLEWTPRTLEGFREGTVPFDEILKEEGPRPESIAWVEKRRALWSTYTRIPRPLWQGEEGDLAPETALRASFCRFDASPESDVPVVSSTCPFPGKNRFHEREHWHRCLLAG